MRLIDADALKETIVMNVYPVTDYFNSRDYGMFWTGGIEKAIDEQPTIESEREKGHWVGANIRSASYMFECSECGGIAYFVHGKCRGRNLENRYCGYNFCPNCGADMRGE